MSRKCDVCGKTKVDKDFRLNRRKCKKCENKIAYQNAKEKNMPVVEPEKKKRARLDLPDGFYEVVEGIAIPAKIRKSLIDTKYAFLKTMEISPTRCAKFKDKAIYGSALLAATNYGKKADKTFIGRSLADGSHAIWRIK